MIVLSYQEVRERITASGVFVPLEPPKVAPNCSKCNAKSLSERFLPVCPFAAAAKYANVVIVLLNSELLPASPKTVTKLKVFCTCLKEFVSSSQISSVYGRASPVKIF